MSLHHQHFTLYTKCRLCWQSVLSHYPAHHKWEQTCAKTTFQHYTISRGYNGSDFWHVDVTNTLALRTNELHDQYCFSVWWLCSMLFLQKDSTVTVSQDILPVSSNLSQPVSTLARQKAVFASVVMVSDGITDNYTDKIQWQKLRQITQNAISTLTSNWKCNTPVLHNFDVKHTISR